MIIEFKFGIGDTVDWLNPYDNRQEVKRGTVNALVFKRTMFRPEPRIVYYVSFILDEQVVCEEEDLTLVYIPDVKQEQEK